MLTTSLGHRQQCLEQSQILFVAYLLMLYPVWLEDPLLWGPDLILVARDNMHCLFGGGRGLVPPSATPRLPSFLDKQQVLTIHTSRWRLQHQRFLCMLWQVSDAGCTCQSVEAVAKYNSVNSYS